MITRKSWSALETLFRLLAKLCRAWVLVLLTAFIASPIGPHVRLDQNYDAACIYAGSRGVLPPRPMPAYPLLAWLDSRGES